jgi:hypothetical protein
MATCCLCDTEIYPAPGVVLEAFVVVVVEVGTPAEAVIL